MHTPSSHVASPSHSPQSSSPRQPSPMIPQYRPPSGVQVTVAWHTPPPLPPGSGGVITGLEVDEGGGGGAFVPDKPPVPLESPGRLEVPPVPGTSTSSFVCSPLVQPSSASASAPAATERTRCAPSLQAKRNTPGLTQWSRMSGMRHDAEKRLDNQRT